ncbi:MAG: hypothetical protein ACFCAD_03375 [Pleurocapsa sp.]
MFFPLDICEVNSNITIPDSKRIMVKLAASSLFSPSASLHKTEFPARAIREKQIKAIVCNEYKFNSLTT